MSRPNSAPPVSEGQEVDVRIESVGDKGDGVARVEGFVVFVPGTTKGDTCKIRIKKVLSSVAFAEKIGPASDAGNSRGPSKPKDAFDDIDLDNLGEGSEDFGEEL